MSSMRGARPAYQATSKGAGSLASPKRRNGYGGIALRPAVLGLAKLMMLPLASAMPLLQSRSHSSESDDELPKDPSDPDLWVYLGIAVALVLLGGVMAGLTIALMGQDETYLQVIATSGEGAERRHAKRVLRLLSKGKHWVLVTLLLSNVITNETLPIVLDRSLGGGWPAVVSSTVLIGKSHHLCNDEYGKSCANDWAVIFGEVAPQSICVRYGLSIGAFMSPVVLILMWIMAPVAWPTAKLLDWLLGEDHGTMYNKPGLKTLVQLHKTLGTSPGDRLMEDEVTIISSVLDLKDKPVGDIMTPMQDVFIMSADTVLDEKMMDTILSQGYSRIPIYAPDNSRNFIGMLLVKILITYDPEDCKRVRDFALATLPETGPYTSCLDIINFFQEGKSHMVLCSDYPGQDKGALGVVTLEDVIEELIGEEIIDESDVFVDVHKAIRRLAPAPRQRYGKVVGSLDNEPSSEDTPLLAKDDAETTSRKPSFSNGQGTTFMMRRKSSNASESKLEATPRAVPVRSNTQGLMKHLSHLGPSNVASKPRSTKFSSVKIKPGVGTIPEGQSTTTGIDAPQPSKPNPIAEEPDTNGGGEGAGLLNNAGTDASSGVVSVIQAGYGTMGTRSRSLSREAGIAAVANEEDPSKMSPMAASKQAEIKAHITDEQLQQETQHHDNEPDHDDRSRSPMNTTGIELRRDPSPTENGRPAAPTETSSDESNHTTPKQPERTQSGLSTSGKLVVGPHHDADVKSVDDDDASPTRERSTSRRVARSGSITETTVDVNGMKKMVLDTNSSSDEDKKPWQGYGSQIREEDEEDHKNDDNSTEGDASKTGSSNGGAQQPKKKKNKKNKKKGKH
jgi:metal transporter CNNM